MSGTIELGLVGYGKIARDQHLGAIAATPGLELTAVASRNAQAPGVANYPTLEAMLAAQPVVGAVVLCQPPQARFAAARLALAAGKHVFLEKPPGATLSEVEALIALAADEGVTLFASWHSREAAAVAPARDFLADKRLRAIRITWREDVRVWHPGQDWIWQPGGFGVFDPGINALSILTELLADPVRLLSADLEVPANRAAPIAARLVLETAGGVPIAADFDFRQTGPQSWDIAVDSEAGQVTLADGGNRWAIDGIDQPAGTESEYRRLYGHFAELIAAQRSDVDLAPLRLVADAFLTGRISATDPFYD